jgi:hypothetical protein
MSIPKIAAIGLGIVFRSFWLALPRGRRATDRREVQSNIKAGGLA